MAVQYRPIVGFPRYRVGDDGSVWSRCYGGWRRLRARKHSAGYRTVMLRRSKRSYQFLIHQLVLLAFVGPCPDGMECRHFPNRDRADNRLCNLQWGTPSANQMDRVVHGTHNRGENAKQSRFCDDEVHTIRWLLKLGTYPKSVIARMFGVSRGCIRGIDSGVNWKYLPTVDPNEG